VRIVPALLGIGASAAAALLLAGCATSAPTPTPTNAATEVGDVVGTWVLDEAFPGAPETPYLAFAADESWQGSDGCNTVIGTWALADDGALTVTAGPSTLIACDGAPLPGLLTAATALTVDAGTLVLSGPDGDTALIATTDPNIGPQDPVGTWGDPEAAATPSLVLEKDGSLTGTDGCNHLTGRWSESDGQVVFADVASTLMACEGVDTWLSGGAYAFLQAGVMSVYAADGLQLGQLARQ